MTPIPGAPPARIPWEEPASAGRLTGAALGEALEELCDRRQYLLLATPYVSFESRFLERQGGILKVRATMGREVAKSTLSQAVLRLRFPWARTFYGGPTRVLDYMQEEKYRSLTLAVPELLEPDERRTTLRMERTGRSTAALGGEDLSILRASLENISTKGAGVFAIDPIPSLAYQAGRTVELSIALEEGPSLHARARVCHTQDQYLGLSFQPPLEGRPLQQLMEWLEPRHQEAQRRWDNRAAYRSQAERALQPKAAPEGVLLLTRDSALPPQIATALEGLQPLRTAPMAMAPLQEAMATPPLLILAHLSTGDGEERHRVRSLLEALPWNGPRLILGCGQERELGRQLAADFRLAVYWDWNPAQVTFFRNLVRGMIRRHWEPNVPTPATNNKG